MASEPKQSAPEATGVMTVTDRPPIDRRGAASNESESRGASVMRSSSLSQVVTAEQAMSEIEARRAWAFSLGLIGACVAGLVLVAVLRGQARPRMCHAISIVATLIAAVTHVIVARDSRRHRRWQVIVVSLVAVCTNVTGYWYWGAWSAYGAVVPVSAYVFASGSPRNDGLGLLVLSIIGHVTVGLGSMYGVIATGAVMPVPPLESWQLITLLVLLQGVNIAATVGGQHAYRSMEAVVFDHGAAIRDLGVRDAQLAEAREAARNARGGDQGRHSGERLGSFTLGAVLGRGAMGEIYDAKDERGQPCAVKVLAAHMLGNEDAVRRFQREARVIASLDSPHIVRTLAVSPPDAAFPYIVMELLAGRDLGQLISERPVRDPAEVSAIVRAIAAGLDAAHDAGIVHRDLKPANVFAADSESGVIWKVLDFGVSKIFAPDATLTAGQVVGTPGYMAPEQARGETVDRRADVYSLGVVAYRLLTGRPAIVPGDVPAMIHEVVYRMPPAPSALGAVSTQVEAVLAVALAKPVGDRFARAGELAAALHAAVGGTLSPAIAARADAVLSTLPWGQWGGRARKKTLGP